MKLKINGLMNDSDILWKKLKCKCDKSDIEKCFPISKCTHCYCQRCEDSMPRETFTVKVPIKDKQGRPTNKTETKIIKEITIDRTNDGYDSIRGWSF
tara:strand:+ start:47 stop:337 length:291 start_codon:yes stop_codon:yes gene_type:complete